MHITSRFHHSHIDKHRNLDNLLLTMLLFLLFLILMAVFLVLTAQKAEAQIGSASTNFSTGVGQNAVPPSAIQAARMPQFASRLAHGAQPAPAASQNASRAAYPRLPKASFKRPYRTGKPAGRFSPLDDTTLYENGPINGTTDAWTINFGFVVSDTFTVQQQDQSSVTGMTFGAWLFVGDTLQSAEVSITSQENGGTVYFDSVVNFTQSGCVFNQYGYNVCTAAGSFSLANLASGTYWVNLQNAVVNSGDPVYWDENSGIGCNSPGCPSQASDNQIGTIPSEAFTILGESTTTCEEVEPQEGFQILHNFTSDEGSPLPGLAITQEGKVYGATESGGTDGLGLAYQLSGTSLRNWTFNPLYSFLGGTNGQHPLPGIIGPDGALYGTADGGVQSCGSSGNEYCGVVYRLTPGPTACFAALCSWSDNVIYRFTGDPNGWQPNGNLVFDHGGNLYGTTTSGGAYGQGAIYELTPSGGGRWSETVIYSFTGGNNAQPDSLLLGQDGNLYGTTAIDWPNDPGVIFQLVHSGGSWTETIISSFDGCVFSGDGGDCYPLLIQESSGNFFGLYDYTEYLCRNNNCFWYTLGRIFMMSPSQSGWRFTPLDDTYSDEQYCGGDWCYEPGGATFSDLAVDSAGNLYSASGTGEPAGSYSYIFKLLQPFYDETLIEGPFGNVEVDAGGNLYGTTGGPTCGNSYGTVWQLTQPQQ